MKQVLRFIGDRLGNAAAEFALLLPITLLILLGALDFGLSVRTRMILQSSTNTGLQHAMATQGEAIEQTEAVIAHALGGVPAAIDVERFCQCASTKVACSVPCGTSKDGFVEAHVSVVSTHALWPDITLGSQFRVYTGKVS